nr:Interleukin-1 receptor-associated kinase 1 [Polyrhizophydium stewartii]
MITKACDAFLTQVGAGTHIDTTTVTNIATLSKSVVEFVTILKKAPKQQGEGVKAVTRFLATNGLEVASTVVKVAKAAADFVPVPGLATAIGIIDKILTNVKDSRAGAAGIKAFCADLEEIKNILLPMTNQWFSLDVRKKCNDLLNLLKEAEKAFEAASANANGWNAAFSGYGSKFTAQVAAFKIRLEKIKELLSLAMQVDSAMMLLQTAKKLNMIDTKTDRILSFIRPRTLHLRHTDFMVSPDTLDRDGKFIVNEAKMDGANYVIKIFREDVTPHRHSIETDARKWFQANHSNLLQLTGICLETDKESGRGPFVAMPHMKYDLESYLAENPVLTLEEKIYILVRVARGIQYLHDYAPNQPIIHGAITMRHVRLETEQVVLEPSNEIVTKLRKVKVIPSVFASKPSAAQTTAYIAPEFKALDYKPDTPLDSYAFGVLALSLLTGTKVSEITAESSFVRPVDFDEYSWDTLECCIAFAQGARPTFSAIVEALNKALGPEKPFVRNISTEATDLDILCSIFPEWTRDSDISTNSDDPTGELVYVYNRETKRNMPRRRLVWDENHSITALRLTGCGLSGKIPKEIGRLTQLRELWLDQNDFEGEIPIQIFKLENLKSLRLSRNMLGGDIPSLIRKLRNLEEIDISYTDIKSLPDTIGELHMLREIDARETNITEIPSTIGMLENLEFLYLSHDEQRNEDSPCITRIPPEIGNLKNLKALYFSGNMIKQLPSWIGKLKLLTDMDLSYNKIKELPTSISNLDELRYLHLVDNELSALPSEIGGLASLTELSLTRNAIEKLPDDFGDLIHLEVLRAQDNELSELPESFGNLTKLVDLRLGHNKFKTMPPQISKLVNLQRLYMNDCELTSIPSFIGNLTELQSLQIQKNQIESLPAEIGKLHKLVDITVQYNKLTALPDEISELKNLVQLYIAFNSFEALPPAIGGLINLVRLWAGGNAIIEIPEWIGSLSQLSWINISHNNLVAIPDALSRLYSLETINFMNNKITVIPESLSTLTRLTEIYLSNNAITEIPAWINRLSQLTIIELNGNQIQTIPFELFDILRMSDIKLADNAITRVPASIAKLELLHTLNLDGNKLTALPSEIAKLPKLSQLSVARNPIPVKPEWFDGASFTIMCGGTPFQPEDTRTSASTDNGDEDDDEDGDA